MLGKHCCDVVFANRVHGIDGDLETPQRRVQTRLINLLRPVPSVSGAGVDVGGSLQTHGG
ncbi:hypothetical protein ABZ379_00440 [Streptomyces canus]|uniref:hypothetical protein n=1 Tax=Streptomyces canus TaxID=58343 RepID=UPI0033DA3BBF